MQANIFRRSKRRGALRFRKFAPRIRFLKLRLGFSNPHPFILAENGAFIFAIYAHLTLAKMAVRYGAEHFVFENSHPLILFKMSV